MYAKKHIYKKDSATAPRQLHQARERRSRSGNIASSIRMRGSGLKSPHAHTDNDQTLINQEDDNGEWTDEEPGSDDDAYFHWEEEATLFSDLLEEATSESSDADLIKLAESLQVPFDEEARKLKRDISGLVPVVNRIRAVFSDLERTVDISSGAGILALNDACRELEGIINTQHHWVQRHQSEYRAAVAEHLGVLEEEYARRDQLWVDFEKDMNELVNPVLEMLNEAPAKMERTITSIEKESRNVEKGPSATELALKNIISKLQP
ncbi:hypothetical protein NP233_g6175 [Leucocoprinus birnbaumii]|uniref:Uncharacterized protein n=1 Tax=Leucocoprinus birnbaumii TaxID=56174 RepID=A0AAD5VRG0_9AGAR|nr:hypothetical protein NP233_g6175 [Leucocoprinus birnbaumii]